MTAVKSIHCMIKLCGYVMWPGPQATGWHGPLTSRSWWRHQMETFSALLALSAGNSPVTGEYHSQRSVTRSFDVFFDLRLNKRSSKLSRRWWFETPWRSLWCHYNVLATIVLCLSPNVKITKYNWHLNVTDQTTLYSIFINCCDKITFTVFSLS